MKKFVIYLLLTLFPVFGGIALVNYIVDPGHIYSYSYIDEVVEGARRGLNVTNVSDMDERILKKKLIEVNHGKQFDYLILGSSRVMTISVDCMNGASILNVGVSGCKLEDMAALLQICKQNGVQFKNVIIGVDPTLFNANDKDSRWKSIGGYYNMYKGENEIYADLDYKITLIHNLFSPSYFKSAIKNITETNNKVNQIKYVKTYLNDGGTKRPDGSIYYAKEYREHSQSWIDNDAVTHKNGSFNDFNSLSQERKIFFEAFLGTLQNNGSNIIIWCCPYHPLFYKRLMKMKGIPTSISYFF